MVRLFIKTLAKDWPALMTGPLSLILLFIPILAPQFTAKYFGGAALVWVVSFVCLAVSAYRAWLVEHRARIAEKLEPLIEDVNLLRELWEKIQYDHRDSKLIQFPLFGFDVKEWEEVHKQLLRLFFWTTVQAVRVRSRFQELGITEPSRLVETMSDQNVRGAINALDYTKLLEEHRALLVRQRQHLLG